MDASSSLHPSVVQQVKGLELPSEPIQSVMSNAYMVVATKLSGPVSVVMRGPNWG